MNNTDCFTNEEFIRNETTKARKIFITNIINSETVTDEAIDTVYNMLYKTAINES